MNDSADYAYIRDFFRRHAGIYEWVMFPFTGIRKKVASLVPEGPGVKVLDVATGTGRQAFAFARRGNTVTGVDLSPDMLAVARSKNSFPNVTLQEGDATALPWEDDSFDVAHISFALHDMPPAFRPRVLAEMRRLTRPGGTVIVVDYALPRFGPVRWLGYHFLNSFESRYYAGFAATDLAALVREADITVLEKIPVLFGMAVIVRGTVA